MDVNSYQRVIRRFWRHARHGWPPGSIWGVADPGPTPAIYVPAADVTLTAASEVLIATTTSALTGAAGMNYIPLILGIAVLTQGATASAALTLAARYNGGSDFATQVITPTAMIALGVIAFPVFLVGANIRASGNGNIGSGAIEITGKTTTTACTLTKIGSYFTIVLLPGPDA
jgi:hypothetical protein